MKIFSGIVKLSLAAMVLGFSSFASADCPDGFVQNRQMFGGGGCIRITTIDSSNNNGAYQNNDILVGTIDANGNARQTVTRYGTQGQVNSREENYGNINHRPVVKEVPVVVKGCGDYANREDKPDECL